MEPKRIFIWLLSENVLFLLFNLEEEKNVVKQIRDMTQSDPNTIKEYFTRQD